MMYFSVMLLTVALVLCFEFFRELFQYIHARLTKRLIIISRDSSPKKAKKFGDKAYQVAHTYGGAGIIVFDKVPHKKHSEVEQEIETIIEHENVHTALTRIGEDSASHRFDNLMPLATDLRRFMDG